MTDRKFQVLSLIVPLIIGNNNSWPAHCTKLLTAPLVHGFAVVLIHFKSTWWRHRCIVARQYQIGTLPA